MTEPLKSPCPLCKGSGTIPHTRRTINGEPDPFDLMTEETCDKCGGGGKVPTNLRAIQEGAPSAPAAMADPLALLGVYAAAALQYSRLIKAVWAPIKPKAPEPGSPEA